MLPVLGVDGGELVDGVAHSQHGEGEIGWAGDVVGDENVFGCL